jgi:predicted nucleic acid-binding protein
MAFLRHVTNRAIMQADALNVENAWLEYDRLSRKADIAWLPEPEGLGRKWRELGTKTGVSGNWWTDAYLAAFAIGHDIRLVTFDADFRRFTPDGLKALVLETPAFSPP